MLNVVPFADPINDVCGVLTADRRHRQPADPVCLQVTLEGADNNVCLGRKWPDDFRGWL